MEALKTVLEALLFASREPLSLQKLLQLLSDAYTLAEIQRGLEALEQDYQQRGIHLTQLASGYCFQTVPQLKHIVARLFPEKNLRCSRALLETLAVIAYRGPITRAGIESIRGVTLSSHLIHTLLEYEWIKVVGQSQVPGHPNLYETTVQFLDHFNLRSLDGLSLESV